MQRRFGALGLQVLGAAAAQMQAFGPDVALPATVVLDREGRIVERFAGVFERAKLEAAVERALGATAGAGHAGEQGAGHVHVARAATTEASLVPS